jgi:hypothetical protein
VTKPKTDRPKTVMWATPDNNLTLSNPRQRAFGFDPVSAPRGIPGGVPTLA